MPELGKPNWLCTAPGISALKSIHCYRHSSIKRVGNWAANPMQDRCACLRSIRCLDDPTPSLSDLPKGFWQYCHPFSRDTPQFYYKCTIECNLYSLIDFLALFREANLRSKKLIELQKGKEYLLVQWQALWHPPKLHFASRQPHQNSMHSHLSHMLPTEKSGPGWLMLFCTRILSPQVQWIRCVSALHPYHVHFWPKS